MTANIRMPLVNSEKNAQIGKVLKEVDTTSEIYQLFESNFNASDRKLHNFKMGSGEWGMGNGDLGLEKQTESSFLL
ncbi:MAG: hypothetical protein ACYTXC_21015, partial [Nostoc sp.]